MGVLELLGGELDGAVAVGAGIRSVAGALNGVGARRQMWSSCHVHVLAVWCGAVVVGWRDC